MFGVVVSASVCLAGATSSLLHTLTGVSFKKRETAFATMIGDCFGIYQVPTLGLFQKSERHHKHKQTRLLPYHIEQ